MNNAVSVAAGLWLEPGSDAQALERLRVVVRALTRARHQQLLLDYACAGLLAGLLLAALVVLTAKLAGVAESMHVLAGVVLSASLVVALLLGWLRRPDALSVVIHADLALRLKQRMSTAWEYMTRQSDLPLAGRLAAHAVKAGLPARPGLVFPLRINRWGWLAPLAATLLLLISTLDLQPLRLPESRTVDERVVEEGRRLSAYAREMQARTVREDLPRSKQQAEQLADMAAGMQSGELSRARSLELLRELALSLADQSRRVLAGVPRTSGARAAGERSGGSPGASSQDALDSLKAIQRAAQRDPRALLQHLDELTELGISRERAQDALTRLEQGDDKAVQEILDKLVELERSRKEQEELLSARAKVREAQENLGEQAAAMIAGRGFAEDADESGERAGGHGVEDGKGSQARVETRGASRYGAQSDLSVAAERSAAAQVPDPAKTSAMLRPQGQVRAGEELVTHGQVLPRTGRPSVEASELQAGVVASVEQALSKEHYPAHAKAYIRRYFLGLSQNQGQGPQPSKQGAP